MTNIKKITSFATATTLTAGILFGAIPTTASAATSPKIVQAQNNVKNQVSSYMKTLNNLKTAITEDDEYIYDNYKELQQDITIFTKYGYTGKDELVKKTASFKVRIDKSRKDIKAIDMKQISATFNTYIKKADAKSAKSYFTKQKSKLMTIRNYQYHLMDDIEEYTYEIQDRIYIENEIFIRKQLTTEYENYEFEVAKATQNYVGFVNSDQEITRYAYKVLDMDYNTLQQIQADLDKLAEKFYDSYDTVDIVDLDIYGVENDDLYTAIEKRDVIKAKIALLNTTASLKKFNASIEQFNIEFNEYKTNLTVKFANKVKVTPTTEQ